MRNAAGALGLTFAATAFANGTVDFNAHWGGAGVVAHRHTENLCANHRIEPGGHRDARVEVRRVGPFGDDVVSTDTAETLAGTLLCGRKLDIWRHTTGPWEGGSWITLRCPDGERPIDGGAGFYTSPRLDVSQVGGGFGTNHEGYWHYRFHNPWPTTETIQFWAVCVRPRRH